MNHFMLNYNLSKNTQSDVIKETALQYPDVRCESIRLSSLKGLLRGDLEFHGENSSYASHNFHAFAAKFPPQLPAVFIEKLTSPGEAVLDPMMGSGTTVLEAAIAGRRAIGYDIDPLALLVSGVKTTPISDISVISSKIAEITLSAKRLVGAVEVKHALQSRFDQKTREFIDYWFLPDTQRELMALILAIELSLKDLDEGNPALNAVRDFFILAFSSIIVTKSGGVSMARDLAHGRPHRVEDKMPKNAIDQFQTRALKNINGIEHINKINLGTIEVKFGDARNLHDIQPDESVHLIVTSPPYANAIDYMRAHKFSLVWFGRSIEELGGIRSTYIGSERRTNAHEQRELPKTVQTIVDTLSKKDIKQADILKKYFIEMQDVLSEMYRVLKPDSAAIMVVGSSTMRGLDVMTHICLADIAANLEKPFMVVDVVPRRLDRNKRMMPARFGKKSDSVIEQRMHEEYVLGFYKP